MKKSDLRILVVDDDPTLGSAIETALKRSGYSVLWAKGYSEALRAVSLNDLHGIVMDCMLPQKSGLDLLHELSPSLPKDIVTVLTSGIYKDKSYAKEAQLQTGARAFLFKPFNIEELINIFDTHLMSKLHKSHSAIHDLFMQKDFSINDRLNAIQNSQTIHGHDLIWVISLLSHPQISGVLTIEAQSVESQIEFNLGHIVQVKMPDQKSFFGTILLEHGYATAADLDEVINDHEKKPIGKKLVDASLLSPHIVDLIHTEQMTIRLSKLILNDYINIKFQSKPAQTLTEYSGLDPLRINQVISDCINSKIQIDWLQALYRSKLDKSILRGSEFSKAQLLMSHPLVKPIFNWLLLEDWPLPLVDILNTKGADPDTILKCIHYLLVNRILIIDPANREEKLTSQTQALRIEKIWNDIKDKDHYQILGVPTHAKKDEIERAYHELSKALHPDRLKKGASQELTAMSNSLFSKISEAYKTLTDESKKRIYINELERGKADEILKAESHFEKAQQYLDTGRYREARKEFEKVIKMKGHRTDCAIYLVWALILEKRGRADTVELQQYAEKLMQKVPLEDRHSARYFYVKGLMHLLLSESNKAYSAFKHALTLEPDFLEPKREISALKSQYRTQKQSVLTDDLSQVVSRMFKNKKSG